ncbi:hypothetical protein [Thauera humireducens]|uniref:hypothetical protein n=1 Tax=Thauera humireducens TaxID=1134435 RepID=UPI00311FABC7
MLAGEVGEADDVLGEQGVDEVFQHADEALIGVLEGRTDVSERSGLGGDAGERSEFCAAGFDSIRRLSPTAQAALK